MAQPTDYDRQNSFTQLAAENPSDPYTGAQLDAEFNAIKTTLDETLANLSLIQADDGGLVNQIVGPDELAASLTIGVNPPTMWATATAYSLYSAVFYGTVLYRCEVAHTSGTFATDLAASKWSELADFNALAVPDDAVTTAKIADLNVTTAKLAASAVTTVKIADDAVTRAKIIDAAMSGADATLITGTAGTNGDLALWNGDGDLVDGPTPPSGTIVGTTDTQVISNKTLGSDLAGGGFDVTGIGVLTMVEQGAAEADVAGRGQIWTKNDTPNTPWFTDDAGTDQQVATFTGPLLVPQGRLTLTTATPVLAASVTAATTVYYTPYVGNMLSLYDGANWIPHTFSELSQATTDSTKSPAACTTNSNYDMFVWNDSGTLRCTRGPAWTSDTTRGTGAATTELTRQDGALVNANDITNGPAAGKGLYVGTIRTDASSQVNMMVGAPTPAAGGTANVLGVWNAHNRVDVAAMSRDSSGNWNYTTATWRAANNSASNRVSFVRGLDEDGAVAEYGVSVSNSSDNISRSAGVGLDGTTPTGAIARAENRGGLDTWLVASAWLHGAGIGFHYVQALEYSDATGTCTWHGDAGATDVQMSLNFRMMM